MPPLFSFRATRLGPNCPFSNEIIEFTLAPGGCVRLAGPSGCGKSTIATFVAGLSNSSSLSRLGIAIEKCNWDPSFPERERVGALFQQTTLLDSLTVAGNVAVALDAAKSKSRPSHAEAEIKRLVEAVGLDFTRDAHKRPSELSGGMARRASLALQLAQRKRVIVLDEPFTGLDCGAAASVANELNRLRTDHGTALLLISHEPDIVALIMGKQQQQTEMTSDGTSDNAAATTACDAQRELRDQVVNQVVVLHPSPSPSSSPSSSSWPWRRLFGGRLFGGRLFGTSLRQRFTCKLFDYCVVSLPLIALAFAACGLAIALLAADMLHRVDVTEPVLGVLDQQVRPLLKMVTGEENNALMLMMVKMKVRAMLDSAVPKAKATLFAVAMAKLFVLEIGPLLTALLLCGRIGGSYAGEVATMHSSFQTKLLRTLGVSPEAWTLLPSTGAALVAAPLLTALGTGVALWCGGLVVHRRALAEEAASSAPLLGTWGSYNDQVQSTVLPPWSDRFPDPASALPAVVGQGILALLNWNWNWVGAMAGGGGTGDSSGRSSASGDEAMEAAYEALVEVVTYPPCFMFLKAVTYILVVLGTAEACARWDRNLTPRTVPKVITAAVVLAGLSVIFADWAFSQVLLLRTW